MEPRKNEIKHNAPEDIDKKKIWITPKIEMLDIVKITQSGNYPNQMITDGTTPYS